MLVKVMREGKEIEIEESEKQDGDVLVTSQEKKGITFSDEQQAHVNSLLKAEREKESKRYKAQIDSLTGELTSYREKETEREGQLKSRLDELKKTAPEALLELIEDAPIEKQIKLIEKHNSVDKPILPNNPKEKEDKTPPKPTLGFSF